MQGIQSFAPGAAGGPDGLRPQHLLDMMGVGGEEGVLAQPLTHFVNLVLGGGVPPPLRKHFFGGRLFALSKPGGTAPHSSRNDTTSPNS